MVENPCTEQTVHSHDVWVCDIEDGVAQKLELHLPGDQVGVEDQATAGEEEQEFLGFFGPWSGEEGVGDAGLRMYVPRTPGGGFEPEGIPFQSLLVVDAEAGVGVEGGRSIVGVSGGVGWVDGVVFPGDRVVIGTVVGVSVSPGLLCLEDEVDGGPGLTEERGLESVVAATVDGSRGGWFLEGLVERSRAEILVPCLVEGPDEEAQAGYPFGEPEADDGAGVGE